MKTGEFVQSMRIPALAFMLLLSGCAFVAPKAAAQIAAAPAPTRGEQTLPLRVVHGSPIDAGRAQPAILSKTFAGMLTGAPVASDNGTAYYYGGASQAGGDLIALDLRTGTVAWRKRVNGLSGSFVASPYGILFNQLPAGNTSWPLVYLDAHTGAQRAIIPSSKAAGAIDGVVFAKNNDTFSYFAFDAKTGEKIWGTYGAGMQTTAPPQIYRGTLLQPFLNDGAILAGALYAFDPANGHAKWSTFANTPPLGYRGEAVYVDSTWFPEQLDNYIPLTVASIDVRTGKKIDEFTYAPDPQQNAATYRSSLPMQAYIAGGYVYLRVNNTWYRYDADRAPNAAHPSRLDGLSIAAVFEDGALLLSDSRSAYIGRAAGDAIAVRALPSGALRSAVAHSANGDAYAVAGNMLYRFDRSGAASAIGSVSCATIAAVVPWPGHVSVICGKREVAFADNTRAPAHLTLQMQRKPRKQLQLHAFTLPPAPGFMHQWWVGPMAPWRDGGVVMTLDHGDMAKAGAIAFVSKTGSIRTVPDGKDLPPPPPGARMYPTQPRSQWPAKPSAVAFDRSGDVWFNNSLWPGIYELDPSGSITSNLVGEVTPTSWKRGAIRLAAGPDGHAWFARSHPSAEIARADGSRAIAIPAQYGEARILEPARDGFWFISATQLVHVTLAGRFSVTVLPARLQLQNIRTNPFLVTAPAGDSIWIASGSYIAHLNAHGMQGQFTLPDATLGVRAMVAACDGSLYVAENAPEVLRLPPGGKAFERYDIGYRELDGFTRTPDCTIWFAEGSNMPTQHAGTLTLQ